MFLLPDAIVYKDNEFGNNVSILRCGKFGEY